MELYTPRLVLRAFCASDFEAVWKYESNPETHRYEKGVPPADAVREMLRDSERWEQENPRTHYRFAVTICPDLRATGRISLSLLNSDIREWEIGWTIHYAHWGKGYATEAARAVVNFAFKDLNAHRVTAFCHAQNTASTRVMEKIGMGREGRLRQVRWWNEGWADEFVYAIVESDWPPEKV